MFSQDASKIPVHTAFWAAGTRGHLGPTQYRAQGLSTRPLFTHTCLEGKDLAAQFSRVLLEAEQH